MVQNESALMSLVNFLNNDLIFEVQFENTLSNRAIRMVQDEHRFLQMSFNMNHSDWQNPTVQRKIRKLLSEGYYYHKSK